MNNFDSPRNLSDQEIAEEFESKNEFEKAAEAYEEAGIYDKASEIWTRLGRPEKAVSVYITAAERIEAEPLVEPESIMENFGRSDLLQLAARLRERAGDFKGAAKDYREAAHYAKAAAIKMEPNRYFRPIFHEVPFQYDHLLSKAEKIEKALNDVQDTTSNDN